MKIFFFIYSLVLGWVKRIRSRIFTEQKKEKIILETLRELIHHNANKALLNKFFNPIINNSNIIMYVSAIDDNGSFETHDILWANQPAKKVFGEDIVGKKCYNVFQDLASVCEFCNNGVIEEVENEPYEWIFFNQKIKRMFFIVDVMIRMDGKRVRVEFAHDITEVLPQFHSVYKKYFNE
jgi:c-di-AMP phosphodiesterase-like protein